MSHCKEVCCKDTQTHSRCPGRTPACKCKGCCKTASEEDSGNQTSWLVGGNGGTNPPTDFLGTTDNKPLYIGLNNTASLRFDVSGQIEPLNATESVYLGLNAGNAASTGGGNISVGVNAGCLNMDGSTNIAIGYEALYGNTDGSNNIAMGYQSLYNILGNVNNVAIGYQALLDNSSFSASQGSNNTAVGGSALLHNTTGSENSALGYATDIASPYNYNGSTAIGSGAVITGNSLLQLGSSGLSKLQSPVGLTVTSDRRHKEDIKDDVPGLSFITGLRPVTYKVNTKRLEELMCTPDVCRQKDKHRPTDQKVRTGFIAQEVEKVAKDIGFDFEGVSKPESERFAYGLCYDMFVVPLVKAVQQQQHMIEELKAEVGDLRSEIKELSKVK